MKKHLTDSEIFLLDHPARWEVDPTAHNGIVEGLLKQLAAAREELANLHAVLTPTSEIH